MNNSIEMKSLVYFCFGITENDDCDTMLTKLINKAYFDATQRGAFNTLLKDDKEKKDAKETVRPKVNKYLKDRIVTDLTMDTDGYDEWHSTTCKVVIEKYKEINKGKIKFSYGNAQKLLNMTMKYLYMLGKMKDIFLIKNKDLLEKVVSLEEVLHIPIDSYIIDAIWRDNKIKLPTKDGYKKKKRSKDDKTHRDYVKGWSTWNEEEYTDVQSSLCEYILNEKKEKPIVWEEKIWIEMAEKRKEGKKYKK